MIEPHYMCSLPPGVARVEWRNITKEWLKLKPPSAVEAIHIAPGCPMQIKAADLASHPWLEAWIEGLELRGLLMRVEN
jgi:hypothetical protein